MKYSVDVVKEIRLIRTVVVSAESGEEAYEKAHLVIDRPEQTHQITGLKWRNLDESVYCLIPPTPLKEEDSSEPKRT